MEAALCLGYGPLPSISLRTVPASTRLHFGFNPSFLSVSSGFMTKCRRFYGPGPLALDRSNSSMASANENGGAKVVRGAVGASLALACALGIIGCGCKMNFKAIAGPKPVYRKAPSFEHIAPPAPRKMALKSLLDVTVSLASKEGRRARDVSPGSHIPGPRPSSPSKDQIDQLKGKYEEAYEFMTTHDQKISELDVRPTLYKAIICTMLDKDDEAQRLWDDFAGSVGGFFPHGF
ncbi:hypothetical protein ES332_A06G162700v1 [Gossypium tomentosum]|uniref:Uncharacterized protein n=1 Tax=Gossypium tomentosum TaxID=34277 RepID=A0A5D2Q4H7_GOSTO|nr:hypothetical protein ES332_A06G162700v1 [Gossypium tomentosum]